MRVFNQDNMACVKTMLFAHRSRSQWTLEICAPSLYGYSKSNLCLVHMLTSPNMKGFENKFAVIFIFRQFVTCNEAKSCCFHSLVSMWTLEVCTCSLYEYSDSKCLGDVLIHIIIIHEGVLKCLSYQYVLSASRTILLTESSTLLLILNYLPYYLKI